MVVESVEVEMRVGREHGPPRRRPPRVSLLLPMCRFPLALFFAKPRCPKHPNILIASQKTFLWAQRRATIRPEPTMFPSYPKRYRPPQSSSNTFHLSISM